MSPWYNVFRKSIKLPDTCKDSAKEENSTKNNPATFDEYIEMNEKQTKRGCSVILFSILLTIIFAVIGLNIKSAFFADLFYSLAEITFIYGIYYGVYIIVET